MGRAATYFVVRTSGMRSQVFRVQSFCWRKRGANAEQRPRQVGVIRLLVLIVSEVYYRVLGRMARGQRKE